MDRDKRGYDEPVDVIPDSVVFDKEKAELGERLFNDGRLSLDGTITCATCHTGVILGGRSFEYLDIYGDYFSDRTDEIAYNSDDDGLKGFTGKDEDLHKFKVPGLRNISLTAPYFHDGTFLTLEDAVKAMARYELGKDLTDKDIQSIVAFMNTLDGNNPHLSR